MQAERATLYLAGTAQVVAHLAHLALSGEGMAAVGVEGSPSTNFTIAYQGHQPCVQAAAFSKAVGGACTTLAVLNVCNQTLRARVAGPPVARYNVTVYSALDAGGWAPLPARPAELPWAEGPLRPVHSLREGPMEFDVPGSSILIAHAALF